MKVRVVCFATIIALGLVLTAAPAANGQTKTPGDPAIFNVVAPPPLPDPNIVCTYDALIDSTVLSAVRDGDNYTAYIIGTPFIAVMDYPTAATYELAYLGYLQRRMNFLSTCLKLQNYSNIISGTEPGTATPPKVTTGTVQSDWFAPDDDGEQNADIYKFFAVPGVASPAPTQADFLDFLHNRLLEDEVHYVATYQYVVHITFLQNNQGGGLKNPVF